MADSKSTASPLTDMVKQSEKFLGVNAVTGPQTEEFWHAQDQILAETEAFAKNWFERRHTATETALEAVKTISQTAPSDPSSAMKVLADWQTHSIERVAEDFREWFELWARCAGHLGAAEIQAGEAGLTALAQAKPSAKRDKDDVPV